MGRLGVRRMLLAGELRSPADAFHVDAASVVTALNDVTELPPPGMNKSRRAKLDQLTTELIELNPEYAALARDRIKGDCPMFGDVA